MYKNKLEYGPNGTVLYIEPIDKLTITLNASAEHLMEIQNENKIQKALQLIMLLEEEYW